MKTRGLGTGLEALFGVAAIDQPASDFEYISLQRIEPRPEQPRSVFEQEKIDELTDSVREHGVLLPLTVRSIGDGFFQIIAGERRWRAARAAGLDEVPVRVVVADDLKATEIAMVENLQREDLSAIEEARGFRVLIEEFGMTQEHVAQRVSKSRPAVANALRLLLLPESVIDLVVSGELSAGSARALLALKDDDMILSAAQKIIDSNMNVREAELLVKRLNKPPKEEESAPAGEVDYVEEARHRLEDALGRRITIRHGKDKGKIEIEYYGQDDFDVLFDELSSIGNRKKKSNRGADK